MYQRPGNATDAVLVSLDFGEAGYADSLEEIQRLAASAGVRTRALVQGRRHRPDPALFAGKGKVEEVARSVAATGAGLAIFNHELSPVQERNLERSLNCRVVDRVSLILDIFAQRAQSHEGKLQVELAQLEHLAPRLVRGWTHLERQKGGIGMRGPGESQLETDRQLLGKRVKALKDKLVKVQSQRATQRRSRSRGNVFTASLVGYTNAGKSTLFNRLTRAGVYAADKLFATLDTTTRRVHTAAGRRGALGHGRLHPASCRTRSWPPSGRRWRRRYTRPCCCTWWTRAARTATPRSPPSTRCWPRSAPTRIPQVIVLNKIDRTPLPPRVERDEYGKISRVWVSAQIG